MQKIAVVFRQADDRRARPGRKLASGGSSRVLRLFDRRDRRASRAGSAAGWPSLSSIRSIISSLNVSPISSARSCDSYPGVPHEVGQEPLDDPVLAHDTLCPFAARLGEKRLLLLAALDQALGLEALQHLPGRSARDVEHLGDARGEREESRRRAACTRRSEMRGSRSSRGTRPPSGLRLARRYIAHEPACKGTLTRAGWPEITDVDRTHPPARRDRGCRSDLPRPARRPRQCVRPDRACLPLRARDRDPGYSCSGTCNHGRGRSDRDSALQARALGPVRVALRGWAVRGSALGLMGLVHYAVWMRRRAEPARDDDGRSGCRRGRTSSRTAAGSTSWRTRRCGSRS